MRGEREKERKNDTFHYAARMNHLETVERNNNNNTDNNSNNVQRTEGKSLRVNDTPRLRLWGRI